MTKQIALSLSILLSAALTACGGGGGDGSPATGASAQAQGRWTSVVNSTPAYTAVGLPSSGSSAVVWALANDASRLAKLSLQDSGALTGRSYALGQNATTTTAVSGQWSTSEPQTITLEGLPGGKLTLKQTDGLTTSAVQADAAGVWKATAGGNAQVVTLTVTAAGAISGQSTTGCTYAGNLVAMASATVYSAAIREACPDNVATQYHGIATLNPARNALSMVATSADETVGVALFLSK